MLTRLNNVSEQLAVGNISCSNFIEQTKESTKCRESVSEAIHVVIMK